MTGTPSAFALSSLEPASTPATRAVVFFETLSVTCPPAASITSAALARESYALLLVDLRLPDGDGLDLLPEARERDPHAVAVVLTGWIMTHGNGSTAGRNP